MQTRIVQISDMHVNTPAITGVGGIDAAAALAAAVETIGRLEQAPDAVIATGDLVDSTVPAAYARLRELLAPLPMPVYLMPGNHDAREALRAAFPDHAYLRSATPSDPIQYRVAVGPLQVVTLDTLEPGREHGSLCDARLDWLERTLADCAGAPVVLAMHHPPFATLIDCMDRIGLRSGTARLARIVSAHPNVEHVICGHLHRAITTRFAGTVASTCPATVHQIHLDFKPRSSFAFTLEPPAIRVHAWSLASGLVSHLVGTRAFEGPFPFG